MSTSRFERAYCNSPPFPQTLSKCLLLCPLAWWELEGWLVGKREGGIARVIEGCWGSTAATGGEMQKEGRGGQAGNRARGRQRKH